MASSLAAISVKALQPSVTLILRSPERVRDYARQGGALTIWREINNNFIETTRQFPAVDATSLVRHGALYQSYPKIKSNPFTRQTSDTTFEHLNNLIICTKIHQTVSAITPLLPTINNNTSILLLQNGMGSFEKLCSKFWPDPANRPQFFMGITTHGVNSKDIPVRSDHYRDQDPREAFKEQYHKLASEQGFAVFGDDKNLAHFRFNHASVGILKIAKVPSPGEAAQDENKQGDNEVKDFLKDDTLNYNAALKSPLVQALKQAPGLQTEVVPFSDFIISQADKLAANAVINPLTSLYECYNGELTALESLDYLMTRIVNECCAVLRAEYKDMLSTEKIASAFQTERMCSVVLDVITKTAENRSSMLQDVQTLKNSEIDYINGYIARLGAKHQIGVLHNQMIVEMVKSKLSLGRDRTRRTIPTVNV